MQGYLWMTSSLSHDAFQWASDGNCISYPRQHVISNLHFILVFVYRITANFAIIRPINTHIKCHFQSLFNLWEITQQLASHYRTSMKVFSRGTTHDYIKHLMTIWIIQKPSRRVRSRKKRMMEPEMVLIVIKVPFVCLLAYVYVHLLIAR